MRIQEVEMEIKWEMTKLQIIRHYQRMGFQLKFLWEARLILQQAREQILKLKWGMPIHLMILIFQ